MRARFRGPAAELTRTLALDTGAAQTLIDSATLDAIGYNVGSRQTLIRLATVSGYEEAPTMVVDEVRALGTSVPSLRVVVRDLPASVGFYGLLGLDFLRGRHLSINFRRGEIELT